MSTEPSPADQSSDQPKSKPGLHVDDEWKARVKAEDAARDAKAKEEVSDANSTDIADADDENDDDSPDGVTEPFDYSQLPPPNFQVLITMLSTQAMAALGLLADPSSGKANQQLPIAKHFIDLLSVVEEKTKRNLTGHEDQLLQSSLHELRMIYVEMTKKK